MIWLFIIGIIVVLMVTHYAVDEPRIKEQKNEQEKSEQEYIKSNHITVTAQYRYASDYYTQNINWTKGIFGQKEYFIGSLSMNLTKKYTFSAIMVIEMQFHFQI